MVGPVGGYALARQLCRRQPRILMYHRFADPPVKDWASPGYFEVQVRHIKERYQPFSAVGLLQYIERHGRVPKHALVITVDDGYRDFYEYAFPILKEYQVPATLYATTGFIDRRLWLWPDKITWLLSQVDEFQTSFTVGQVRFSSGTFTLAQKQQYWRALVNYLLSVRDEQKHGLIEKFAGHIGVSLPAEIPDQFAPMNWAQLEELENAGIEVGGHTVSHPTLGQVTECQARDEIFGCRDELDEHLGSKPRTFCYPNGQPSDFQPFLQPLVEEAGFLGAVTAFPDGKGFRERYAMRRHVGGDSMFQFHKAVSGVEYLGHRLRGDIKNV